MLSGEDNKQGHDLILILRKGSNDLIRSIFYIKNLDF